MTGFLIVAWALLGGLWRVVLGGWLGWPRWACVASYGLLLAPAWGLADWRLVAAAHAYAALYWLPGHRWDDLAAMARRYGPLIGPLWHWTATRLPDAWQPTRLAEASAGFLYHLALFGLLAVA